MPMDDDMEMVIHAMYSGYPLCGFSDELPRDWPTGHGFVPYYEIMKITCPECRPEAERLKDINDLQSERPSRRA